MARNASGPLTEEQSRLASDYFRLVIKRTNQLLIARGIDSRGQFADRVRDVAIDLLFRAARKFEPSRGVKFATYIRLVHRFALGDVVKWQNSKNQSLRPMQFDGSFDPIDHRRPPDLDGSFEGWLDGLRPRERLVLGMRFRFDMNQREIAESMGCSRAWVNAIYRAALWSLTEKVQHDAGP